MPAFAWRKNGEPLRKNHPSSPERDTSLDIPVIGSLALKHETSALANYTTETARFTRTVLYVLLAQYETLQTRSCVWTGKPCNYANCAETVHENEKLITTEYLSANCTDLLPSVFSTHVAQFQLVQGQ
uniref:Uncharacterized protein n=1 Tax=Timema tahoe TaxID=61484 RepID=A0A7R9IGV6_9NEOP|nr:unnamed protein product [Timema tahoe]